jgi:hypothetical protein
MQKFSTPKHVRDSAPKQQIKREPANGPSICTMQFILGYGAALTVLKTKFGVFNILQN